MKKRSWHGALVAIGIASLPLLGACAASSGDGDEVGGSVGGTVMGTVDVSGLGRLPGIRVTLGDQVSTLTDAEGAFRFSFVPQGVHEVTAQYRAYRYSGTAWARLEGDGVPVVNLTLQPNSAVGKTVGVLTPEDIPGVDAINIQDVVGHEGIVVLCDVENGFEVVDVSDPTAPALIGGVLGDRNCEAAALDWPLLYCGWNLTSLQEGGVAVYSLADPTSPVKLGEVVTDNRVYGISLDGTALYAIGDAAFQVYDVTDPKAPSLLGSLPMAGEGVEHRSGYAFVATDGPVLTVVDVREPSSPVVVWRSAETSSAVDCAIDGTYVYVAADRLYQYDVRDPTDVRLVGVIDAGDLEAQGAGLGSGLNLEGLSAAGGSVYLGAMFDGMVVVDYSDPHRPRFAWQSDGMVPFAMNVYVNGAYAYTASWTEGLRVVRRK